MRGAPTSPRDPDQPGPTPRQVQQWRRATGRPPNEIPGTVAVDVVLARTDDLVVAIIGMHAYSTGLAFDLAIRQRTPAPPGYPPRGLHDAVAGFGAAADRDILLLGFGYPDGRTTTNLRWGARQSFDVTDQPQLLPGSGGGNWQAYDGTFFLSPLPTGGDLTVVCAWPSRGITETKSVIPAELISEATAHIVELWPWGDFPDEPAEPPAPPLPDLPAGSWFAGALARQQAAATEQPGRART